MQDVLAGFSILRHSAILHASCLQETPCIHNRPTLVLFKGAHLKIISRNHGCRMSLFACRRSLFACRMSWQVFRSSIIRRSCMHRVWKRSPLFTAPSNFSPVRMKHLFRLPFVSLSFPVRDHFELGKRASSSWHTGRL
jgi:hypothetical protein